MTVDDALSRLRAGLDETLRSRHRHGTAWPGMAHLGTSGQGRLGSAGLGMARRGRAGD